MPKKVERIECICEVPWCRNIFYVTHYRRTKGRGRFCSKTCANRWNGNENMKYSDTGELLEKRCSLCKEWLAVDHYRKRSAVKCGYESWCKKCTAINDIQRKYGISEELASTYATGQVICIIRKCTERAVVDHCHDTGVYRMPLCKAHNIALGLCHEDPEVFEDLLIIAKYCQLLKTDRSRYELNDNIEMMILK